MGLGNSRRDVTVRMRGDVAQYVASQRLAGAATRSTARDMEDQDRSAGRMSNQIDKLSGRVAIYRDLAFSLGPAAVPIGSVAVPALTALATQGLAAATALGVAVVAAQGVGDALKAVEKARLEPTAENIQAAQLAMAQLGPDAQRFVTRLQELRPVLRGIRDASAEGLFGGGLTESLDNIDDLAPTLERIGRTYGKTLGEIADDSTEALASKKYEEFFDYLDTDGAQALRQTADLIGNLGRFLGETLIAFDPASDNVIEGLVDKTDRLADAAGRMDDTQGFQDFLAYVRETGPQVLDTLGAAVNLIVQLGQALAPLGGPVLQVIEGLANGFAAIADSDLGTPIFAGLAALALYNRGLQLGQAILARSGAEQQGYFARTADGYRRQVTSVREIPAAMREVRAANAALISDQGKLTRATGQYNAALQLRARASGNTAQAQFRMVDAYDRLKVAEAGVAATTERSRAAEARRAATFRDSAAGIGKTAGAAAGLTIATSGLADGIGLSNTASLALIGTLAGPWGAAVGGSVGLVKDLAATAGDAVDALTRLDNALDSDNADDLAAAVRAADAALDDLRNQDGFGDSLMDAFRRTATVLSKGDFGFFDELEDKSFRAEEALARLGSRGVGSVLTQGLGADARGAAADLEYLTQGLIEYKAALDKLAGEYSLEQGLIATREAIRGIRDVAKDNPLGKEFADGLGKAGQQGDALRSALLKAGQQAIDTANLMDDADSREYLKKTRRSIIETARALGLPMPKVRELLGSLGMLDKADATPEVKPKGVGKTITDLDAVRRIMRTLPPEVASKVVAEGVPTTVASMRRLIQTYGLTPDEVNTLIGESGGAFTGRQIQRLIALAQEYGGQRPKARLNAQDNASGVIRTVLGLLAAADGFTAVSTIRTVRIEERRSVAGGTNAFTSGVGGGSEGGRVIAMAGGGTVPGQRLPYGDSVYIFAAPGEEIITNRGGEADRFRADRAAGRIPSYADGGTVGSGRYAASGGMSRIEFPPPAVSKAALIAAQGIATAAEQTAQASLEELQLLQRIGQLREDQVDTLEVLQAQQRVSELKRSLDETEKITVKGKDGKDDDKRKKGLQDTKKVITRKRLRGIDAQVAREELAAAQRDLLAVQGIDTQVQKAELAAALQELDDLRTGRKELEEAAEKEAEARQQAAEALADARNTATDTYARLVNPFRRGNSLSSIITSTDRDTAEISLFGALVGRLQSAGASASLLKLVTSRAEAGEVKSANKLAQALLNQPALLGQLNTSLGNRDRAASTLGLLTTDPSLNPAAAFSATAGTVVRHEVTVSATDPSAIAREAARQAEHLVRQMVTQMTPGG